MAQYMFSFLSTSLIMAVIILATLALGALMPRAFSPKLRYGAWIVILIGLIIPFRPMLGGGLVTVQMPYYPFYQPHVAAQPIINEEGALPSIAFQEPVAAGNMAIPISNVLAITWAVVALAILLYHLWRYISFVKLVKRWSVPQTDKCALAVLQAIKEEKGIAAKKIGLRTCDFVSTSMLVGFVSPIILLPDKDFDADELELIFRHELIHYKRGDLFVKLMSVFAIALNWFNPAVYIMSAAMQADCEASCDEAVIADIGSESRQFYAEIIMDMIGSKRLGGTMLSTSFYGSKSGIKKRMEAIMNASGGARNFAFASLSVVVLLIALSGSIFAFASQQEQPYQPEPQAPAAAGYPVWEPTPETPAPSEAIQITNQRAREIAMEFVGYGTVYGISAFTEAETLIFEVEIRNEAVLYVVQINANNGSVINLATYEDAAALTPPESAESPTEQQQPLETPPPTSQPTPLPTPQPTLPPVQHTDESITAPAAIIPRPPARTGGPVNPSITAQRAVELAHDYLISIGVTNALFDYVYMDIENGTWVWSVEFDGQGRSFEFYVDVNTGVFLKAPQMAAESTPAANPTPQPATPQPTTSPPPAGGQDNRPSNPAISLQRAIEIAEADIARRGINATFHRDSGMDWERGQWVWELLFRTQGERMPFIEFYISVDDGSIVKFEWDD